MALTNENGGMYMPVAPAYAGGNGFGNGFGGDWGWIILLLLCGWGGNGFGGFGGNGEIYPWMNQANLTSNGFQNQMLNDNITSIRDGINGISTQLCNGFGDVQMGLAQAAFNNQTSMLTGFNNLSTQFANCCCENRLGIANLNSTILSENCADRYEAAQNTRNIIESQNAGFQKVLDQMCADKIDAKNEKIADLERQLTMANLAASQTAQTSRILADNAAQTVALEQYLNPVPVPAYMVQNPNCCTQNFGCGCGCGV